MKENRNLEFKEEITSTFLKTVSAFSNYDGGVILFGINDSGEVSGLADPERKCLDIENITVNIHEAMNGVYSALDGKLEILPQTRFNLPARIRMSVLYAVSQSKNGRVINTCNLSEDWVGYSTRYGDAAGDVSPLSHFTVAEVKAMGRELGLPEKFIEKPPIDGLCGKTDEDNLGFTYETLDKYIREGIEPDEQIKNKIDTMHEKNLFKLSFMPCYDYFKEKSSS
jgi:NAD+ synthase